jgi:hypothetical protein
MTPLQRVTERVLRNGNPQTPGVPAPLLTLEEFFEGNDLIGSIGCNLATQPQPSDFYDLLKQLRVRRDVSDIRVEITCVDHPGADWPFSDTVWIMTDAKADTVAAWFPQELAPNLAHEGWNPGMRYEQVPVLDGHRPISVWWD